MRDAFSTALKLLLAVFLVTFLVPEVVGVHMTGELRASSMRSARRPATRKLWRKGTCASPRY